MTDTVAQAAEAVKSDVTAAIAADAAGGTVAAAESVAGSAAHIAGQAVIAGADAVEVITNDTNAAAPAAETLFAKIKAEIYDDVVFLGAEWDLLKEAIAKHL